jgi:hypothetical protein
VEQVQDQVVLAEPVTAPPAVQLSDEGELLLRRVVGAMRKDLKHWNQRHWVSKADCGTQGCLAGWIVSIGQTKTLEELFQDAAHGNLSMDFPGTALDLLGLSSYSRFRDLFDAIDDDIELGPNFDGRNLLYAGDRDKPRKRFKLFLAQVTEMTGVDF